MFFWRKKRDEFLGLSKNIRNLLDKGNYDSAIAKYNKYNIMFNNLTQEKKYEYDSEYNSVTNQLLILIKIIDLKVVIEGDNITLMTDILESIKLLMNTTEDISKSYSEYVKNEYNKLLSKFNYKLTLSDFNRELDFIYKLKDEGNYDQALYLFPDLIAKYRELRSYSSYNTKKILNDLIRLREELKMKFLESRAYSEVAEVDINTLKRSLKKREVEKSRELHKKIFGS